MILKVQNKVMVLEYREIRCPRRHRYVYLNSLLSKFLNPCLTRDKVRQTILDFHSNSNKNALKICFNFLDFLVM